ncbi:hypothetical protein [Yersinia phage fHe-Yen9-04]|uniref:Uncharacterized protein n=1 Tax=Yersinia phage fHe-Yen9-04 TaxID=2052742 RepID=A0A2C9CYK1_9CAUD|nr:hypothetical protein FDJ41_gp141 [Yersinia phage fHe-Yen9-04]SOK58418.1 hypothetical protein [Yersinia phage fHe-Yen9-04]VUE36187.1 hypothetical protein [Yersinia phage fHe-Yen9-04]
MFSKYIKMKNCYPDKLYNILLKRFFIETYPTATNVILHHSSTYSDGKIVTSVEFWFPNKLVFVNAHVYIDDKYQSINVFNTDKLLEFM